ncbi:SCF ubiquitin ligase complex subunit [Malassezia cuniculi]|uniref:SCF ubiquitin ligase complex subunit n=1 Tax=Malassezia cuniculi TaxID=948313 RepID=A0AAF0EUX7_9BASI|nr:SCF ubiquitin ligase complex subunit [Malassezia cuniculi]
MRRDVTTPAAMMAMSPVSPASPSSSVSDDVTEAVKATVCASLGPQAIEYAQGGARYAELPLEILLQVFRYVLYSQRDLRACILVCRRWCACGIELLWHRPVVHRTHTLFQLVHVLMQGRAFPYAQYVRRLNFSLLASDLEDSLFGRIGLCTKLQRLTLAGCDQVAPETLVKVLRETRSLVSIDLTGVTQTTDAVLEALAEYCPRLQGANLTGCRLITSRGVQTLARCTQLRRVKLCGCEDVDDAAFLALLNNCPHILELDLMHCPRITDAAVGRVWLQPNQLRELRLGHCSLLTDASFPTNTLRSVTPEPFIVNDYLRVLDVTGCHLLTDASVRGLVDHAPRLRNLVLAKCSRLSDASVYAVSELGRNLQYLHLAHLSLLTDRAVIHLVHHCTRIRYLDLACCVALTDASVIELAANLQKLRRIGLVRVAQLTDASVYALVERQATLERIHLSYCEQLSVPAIFWLTQRLGRLTHLSLTGVPAFRRPELQSMCRPPPREFNHHQRQAFCVYSGRGVDDLRRYLAHIYSDEVRAAQFGTLHPDVRRALGAGYGA